MELSPPSTAAGVPPEVAPLTLVPLSGSPRRVATGTVKDWVQERSVGYIPGPSPAPRTIGLRSGTGRYGVEGSSNPILLWSPSTSHRGGLCDGPHPRPSRCLPIGKRRNGKESEGRTTTETDVFHSSDTDLEGDTTTDTGHDRPETDRDLEGWRGSLFRAPVRTSSGGGSRR